MILPKLPIAALALAALAGPARAERLVSAFDPRLHVKPPMMRGVDGESGHLTLDAEFLERAARLERERPAIVAAEGAITRLGEVVVVEGDEDVLTSDGTGFGIRQSGLAALARKVIGRFGDYFQAITVFLTFTDRSSAMAEAYEMTVRNDIHGLGPRMPVRDMSAAFGSRGVLRSMLNMKTVGLRAGDTPESWRIHLETWGQESGHRWSMFFSFRDRRTGRPSDALLGRDCAHYSRFVDTQASVHDGLAWRDNGNGTFTWTEANKRYGFLDLYGMGLMAPDEVPPFFLIDDIPGYTYPTCERYAMTPKPREQTVMGKRVDVTIDDIIAANGERVPSADEVRQDYWREAIVVLTTPGEGFDSPRVAALVERLNRARLWWEDWARQATRKRLVICTQASADCGDPRSDVIGLELALPEARAAATSMAFAVEIGNGGARPATGVVANLEVTVGGETRKATKDLGVLEPGGKRSHTFVMDLKGSVCGDEVTVKASTQSDFHYSRRKGSFLLGAETRVADGFEQESGWTVNPDGDDSSSGAQWERGRPEATTVLQRPLHQGGARTGDGAWVTGLAASTRGNLVTQGKATLQSPAYETGGLRDPMLRYWVRFAGIRADGSAGLEPSVQSRLTVLGRALDMPGGVPAGPWVEVDRIDNYIGTGWDQRTVALPPELLARSRMQLRFVAADGNATQGGVKVAIDDLEITSNLPICYAATALPGEDGGCDCAVGSARRAPGVGLLLLVGAAALAIRRRRPRR